MHSTVKRKQRRNTLSDVFCLIAFNTSVKKLDLSHEKECITIYIGTLVNVGYIIDEKYAAIRIVDLENQYNICEEDFWKCPRDSLIHVDKTTWPYLNAVSSPVERVFLLKEHFLCQKLVSLEVGDLIYVTNIGNESSLSPAIIKYKGKVNMKGPGTFYGVELMDGEGECDGSFGGQRYFQCPPNSGLFTAINRIRLPDMIPTVSAKISSLQLTDKHNGQANGQDIRCQNDRVGLRVGDRVVWLSDLGPKQGVVRWMGSSDSIDLKVSVQFDDHIKTDYLGGPEYTRTCVLPAIELVKACDFFGYADLRASKRIEEAVSPVAKLKDLNKTKASRENVSNTDLIIFDNSSNVKDSVFLENEEDLDLSVGSLVEVPVKGSYLFGVVRWQGRFSNHSPLIAGVELEEEVIGLGNGVYNDKRYFTCSPGHALFVNVADCKKDNRFPDVMPSTSSACVNSQSQDGGHIESPIIHGIVAPVSREDDISELCGKFRGIQGHHNSCYLDATLFSMFTFTSVFDSLLLRPASSEDLNEYDEVQTVLREEIVNPLRTNLYVSSDRVMKLRTLMDKLSSVSGLTSEEKDPEEFLTSLVAQILRAEPYLKLSSGQEAYLYQLFLEKDESITFPTVQQLFDQSFLSSDIKLMQVPSCLIIQMPRFGKSYKMYPRILPSQVLDVTDVIYASPRQCTICGKLAEFECKQCFNQCDAGLQSISFCSVCLGTAHGHERRRKHQSRGLVVPEEFVELSEHCPVPRLYMSLFAVVCIETSHYVSFVKCGSGSEAPWCFFDSMADRKGEQDGYNIPEVVACPDLPYWLSERGSQVLSQIADERQLPEHAKRLLCDAYMCIYQSSEMMMYR